MASGNNDFFDDQVDGHKRNVCDPCKKKKKTKPATVYCRTCRQFQCAKCETGHELYNLTGHEIVDVGQATTEANLQQQQAPSVDMNGMDKCDVHEEVFEFFCVGHGKLCCRSCAIEQHRKCYEVNELSKQATKAKLVTTDVLATVAKLQTGAAAVTQFLQKSKASMRTQLDNLPGKSDSIKETISKGFDELKVKAVEKAKVAEIKMSSELETKLSKSERIDNNIRKLQDTLRSVTTQGSPSQIFIAVQVLEKQIMSYQAALNEQQTNLETFHFSIDYNEMLTTLVSTGGTIGNLCIDSRTEIEADPTKPVHLALMTSLDVKQGADDKREPLYKGLAFLPDGRLVVTDNKNSRLYVMNEKLEKVGKCILEFRPQCVTVISEDQVAVTSGDRYKVFILHVSKKNTVALVKTLKTKSQYDSICLMNNTTFVVSTFEDERPVRMITMAGEERDFPDIPKKEYKRDECASAYMRDNSIIVLTDRFKNEIYLYDVKDKFTTRCVVNIKAPRGVCVGPNDRIFVCSRNTNSVVQVSVTGRVISSYKVDMKFPRIVCVSKDGSKMVVSNNAIGLLKMQLFHIK